MPVSLVNASMTSCGTYSDQQKRLRFLSATAVVAAGGSRRLLVLRGLRGWCVGEVMGFACRWRLGRFSAAGERHRRKDGQHQGMGDFFHEVFRRVKSSLNKTSRIVAMTKIVLNALS